MDSIRLINSNYKQDLRHIVPLSSHLFPIFPPLIVFHEHYLFSPSTIPNSFLSQDVGHTIPSKSIAPPTPSLHGCLPLVIKWKLKSSPLSHMVHIHTYTIFFYMVYMHRWKYLCLSYLLYPAPIRIKFVQSSDLSCPLPKYSVYRSVST